MAKKRMLGGTILTAAALALLTFEAARRAGKKQPVTCGQVITHSIHLRNDLIDCPGPGSWSAPTTSASISAATRSTASTTGCKRDRQHRRPRPRPDQARHDSQFQQGVQLADRAEHAQAPHGAADLPRDRAGHVRPHDYRRQPGDRASFDGIDLVGRPTTTSPQQRVRQHRVGDCVLITAATTTRSTTTRLTTTRRGGSRRTSRRPTSMPQPRLQERHRRDRAVPRDEHQDHA